MGDETRTDIRVFPGKTFPGWIRARAPQGEEYCRIERSIRESGMTTVCVEAACPNRGECWSRGHITFMILGDICTRGCVFCGVINGEPDAPDLSEPGRIASLVVRLGMKYVVITSVTRDDLADRGSGQFKTVCEEISRTARQTRIELLIPDMGGDSDLVERTVSGPADVVGHNIEMPERLYGSLRPEADYRRSLEVLVTLGRIRNKYGKFFTKSSIMLGLGENGEALTTTFRDLRDADVDILYLGQYLNPSKGHMDVEKFYTPAEFLSLKEEAGRMGFRAVLSGPLVRSSYAAERVYEYCANCS